MACLTSGSSTCTTCLQGFNLMIRFECAHLQCVYCFATRPSGELPLKCPTCEKPTNTFRYSFQTVMNCDACKQQKTVDEFWWCDDCCDTLCSLCAMQAHKNCDTTPWNRMEIWKYYVDETERRIDFVVQKEKKKIDQFLSSVKSQLYNQVDNSAKLCMDSLSKDDKLICKTFEIGSEKHKKDREKLCQSDNSAERKRLRAKSHLERLLQALRFGGNSLEFTLSLKHLIPPEESMLNEKMEVLSIDGSVPANK